LPNLFVTANRGSQLHRLQRQVVVADVLLFDDVYRWLGLRNYVCRAL